MLLIIHNLPNKMRYADVKSLIRDRCGLTEIILDNLTYVHPDSYKVTVGLTDENDATILFTNLNGLDCMGQKLFVEDLRNKKQSSKNLDCTGGIQMQQKQRGNNIGGVQNKISGTQPMPAKSFYVPMNTYSNPFDLQSNQESPYQHLAPVFREPDSMMNTQPPATYNTGVGGKYGASCTTIIPNTNPSSYNVSSSFGNDYDQQGIYNTNDSQSNSISYSAKKPFYQSYNVNQDNSRYFQKKNDEPLTSDNRRSLDKHTRDTSERSKRMPPIRNEREAYESHNRSDTSNERRLDDWKRSDDFSRRSDSYISYPVDRNNKRRDNHTDRNQGQVGDDFSRHSDSRNSYPSDRNNKRRDNYSDRNQREAGDTYNRSFDRNYKDDVRGKRIGNNYSQHSSSGYNTYSSDHSGQYDKSAYSGGDYNRPKSLNPRQTGNNSFINRSNSQGKNEFGQSYKANPRGIASDQSFGTRKLDINNKQNPARYQQQFPYSRGNDFKESRKPMNAPPQVPQYSKNKEVPQALNKDSKSKKKDISSLTPQELKNRDETWRNQATSAIAKDLVMNCGNTDPFLKQYNFMNYLKPFIKSRINEMIGKRVAVPLEQILDEYNQRYRPGTQKAFLNDIIKQFQESSTAERGDVSRGVVEASGSATVVNKGIKRVGNDDIGNLNPAKKSKNQSNLHPYNVPLNQQISTSERLPKYPDGDKKGYNKLKRQVTFGAVDIGDVYEMDPQLKKVRDDEINALCNVFLDECKNHADENEAKICKRIVTAVDGLRNELRLSITKRVLNITHNIPLRLYASQKIQSTEIDNHLKKLGIISLRKSRGRKLLYIAICNSFNAHDRLCDMGRMEIGNLTLLFRPMNSGKLKKVKHSVGNNGNKKDAGYTFHEDVTDDKELFEDDDIGYDEEDYDEEHNDDSEVIELQSDDYNDVEIIDDTHGVIFIDDETNVENKNTDEAKSEMSQTQEETSKSEINVIKNSDKSNDNKIQESETENLLKDIQTLTDRITNEENVNDVNVNSANTTEKTNDKDSIAVDVEDTKPNYEDLNIDVENISQDDLEDF
ncbi:unnamed protein product [Parnassius apollo]|uniref:(apollo) hypothetical protein n=1 Tax=Parnassius apollo TaxID=110799 RepID=A0A8S3YCS4_PARAO|nr:unnamed protein product [Parnassius apollo]